MKTKFICKLLTITVMVAGAVFSYGQTNNPTTKEEKVIRIKMVKNINGVETVFDTSIVDGEWNDIHSQIHNIPYMKMMMDSIPHSHGKEPQLIVKTIDIQGGNGSLDSTVMVQVFGGDETEDLGKIMKKNHLIIDDAEFQILLKEHGIDLDKEHGKIEKQVIILDNEDIKGDDRQDEKSKMEIKVVISTCNIEDLSKEDRKKLKNEERSFNEKLKVDAVEFYPNPNNGRFNLGFNLEKQGDTEITILDIYGKQVYNEKLSNFSGSYKKEIDISNHASGTYYIKVTQGKDSFFKKMVLQ